MDSIADIYNKKTPKWFRAIRWREWGQRVATSQKLAVKLIYIPTAAMYLFFNQNRLATWLYYKRPQTQEEFDALKRQATFSDWPLNAKRNYTIGQYDNDIPPLYDLAVRRQAYPEYYAGRYDGFVKSKIK